MKALTGIITILLTCIYGGLGFWIARKSDAFFAKNYNSTEKNLDHGLNGKILVCGKNSYTTDLLNYLEKESLPYCYYENGSEIYEESFYSIALLMDQEDYNNLVAHAYCKRYLHVSSIILICNDAANMALYSTLDAIIYNSDRMPEIAEKQIKVLVGGLQHE